MSKTWSGEVLRNAAKSEEDFKKVLTNLGPGTDVFAFRRAVLVQQLMDDACNTSDPIQYLNDAKAEFEQAVKDHANGSRDAIIDKMAGV